MKNTRSSAEKEMRVEVRADSVRPDNAPALDPFDTTLLGSGIPNYALDPKFGENLPPLVTTEQEELLKELDSIDFQAIEKADKLAAKVGHSVFYDGEGVDKGFDEEAAWIQTHSGRRFN